MNLQTKIPLKASESQIDYQSRLLLLGSCFAENMGHKLEYFKFPFLQNPFGILFHPLALENLIFRAVKGRTYLGNDVFFLDERWHCYDAHSHLSDISKDALLQRLNDGLERTNQQMAKSTHILITLGTAWVYESVKTGTVVANCHKVPQKEFVKRVLSVSEIYESLERVAKMVHERNKGAQIVFTVSPVRHLKDGFTENQRSKAHLIAAVHELLGVSLSGSRGHYFPSYELMMDELRDYRFYGADMIHPNPLAIDYIWEKFKEVWISERVYSTMAEVDSVQKGLAHRPFNVDSERHRDFLKSLDDKIAYLKEEYPFMNF